MKKALNFINEEIRRLELAPEINGCEMTPEWFEMLEIYTTIKSVLIKEMER